MPFGCSNQNKVACLELTNCSWVVGKGCRVDAKMKKPNTTTVDKSPIKTPIKVKTPIQTHVKKQEARMVPPFPAKNHPGMTMIGKDGTQYISVASKLGKSYRWQKIEKTQSPKSDIKRPKSIIIVSDELKIKVIDAVLKGHSGLKYRSSVISKELLHAFDEMFTMVVHYIVRDKKIKKYDKHIISKQFENAKWSEISKHFKSSIILQFSSSWGDKALYEFAYLINTDTLALSKGLEYLMAEVIEAVILNVILKKGHKQFVMKDLKQAVQGDDELINLFAAIKFSL
jgi:predicted hydrolase (HD superfamily)